MCRGIWRFLQSTGYAASTFWQWVYGPWRFCSAQSCVWWCLCCNRWLCWGALILLAVLLIAFFVLYVVWTMFILIICESLCVTIAILQAPSGNIRVRCLRYWDDPEPPSPDGSGTGTGALTSPPTTGTGVNTAPKMRVTRIVSGAQYVATCGCREGKIGLVISLGLLAVLLMLNRSVFPAGGWRIAIAVVTFAFAGAVFGKLVGLLYSRSKHIDSVRAPPA
jgi:hypothetical protein